MASFENFRKHWFWAIFAFCTTTIIAVVALFLQYKSTQHELGGELNAKFHSLYLNSRETRTIVVCVEDTSINISNLYITPTFDNPSEYSLKDFSLTFDAECTNVEIEPSSFVEKHDYGANEQIFKYKDNILAAHDDTKKPFSNYFLKDSKGRCYIKTKASYDGAPSAFEYTTDVWFFLIPKKSYLSYEDWKIDCKKKIFEFVSSQYYDVYYYAKNHESEYQVDIALNSEKKQKNTSNDKVHVASHTKKDENKKSTTATVIENVNNDDESSQPATVNKTNPVVTNDNQDINLVKYTTSYKDSLLTISMKFNKTASEDGLYLLYGTYTLSDSEEQFCFCHTIDIEAGKDRYEFRLKTGEEHFFKEDLRIIKQAKTECLVEISDKGESKVITNKTNNDIVLILNSTDHSYTSHVLCPQEKYYNNKSDYTLAVFDTGIERDKEDLSFDKRYKVLISKLGYWSIIGYIICFLGYIILGVMIWIFFCELKDTQSFSIAWKNLLNEFSLREVFLSDKEPMGFKIFLSFTILSPLLAILFTIYVFLIF